MKFYIFGLGLFFGLLIMEIIPLFYNEKIDLFRVIIEIMALFLLLAYKYLQTFFFLERKSF